MVRLTGGPSDAEMLGELVWAPGYQGMRWPGEMLDPFRLPPSRSLPVRAIQGLPTLVHASIVRLEVLAPHGLGHAWRRSSKCQSASAP